MITATTTLATISLKFLQRAGLTISMVCRTGLRLTHACRQALFFSSANALDLSSVPLCPRCQAASE
jgi:hypothetical protein